MTSSQFVIITSVLSKLASFYTELSNHCMEEFANPQATAKSQSEPIAKKETSVAQPKVAQHDNEGHNVTANPQQKQSSTQMPIKKKGRPRKQPAPKVKAFTAYYFYFQQNKQRVAARYNISNMKDLATILSKEWKCLPQSERAKYHQKAVEEQSWYREGTDSYRKDYEAHSEMRKKSTQEDESKPMKEPPKSKHNSLSSSSDSSSSSSSSSSQIKPSSTRVNKAQAVIFIEDSSQTSSRKDNSLEL